MGFVDVEYIDATRAKEHQERLMDSPADDKGSKKSFAELARELECDEDETRFEEAVRKVAPRPPSQKDG